MGKRDVEGYVSWPCSKCKVVFKKTCGQLFWEIGEIEPPWKESPIGQMVGRKAKTREEIFEEWRKRGDKI